MAGDKVLLYDGECGFCRRWVERWKIAAPQVEFLPFQEAGGRFPDIPSQELQLAVQLVTPQNRYSGAHAVFQLLALAPGRGLGLRLYRHLPGFAATAEAAYRLVAAHRQFFSRLSFWLWGRSAEPSTYFLARRIFIKILSLCYLAAFLSLLTQISGLMGQNGIAPVSPWLAAVKKELGHRAYALVPTVLWLGSSDGLLRLLCLSGAGLSLLLIVGIAPAALVLSLLWSLYLSLTVAGRVFMSFQWDILLLEAGFLAIFAVPWRLWPRGEGADPARLTLFLLRWLLFRLMFQSGAVKWLSGDAVWRDLTALGYHYQTQPLPTWIGWFAHQAPLWVHKFSVGVMSFIETALPFLIFLPRRPKIAAFFSLVFLQVLIASTGNYCFFNLLTVALCVLLLDDEFLRPFLPRKLSLIPREPPQKLRVKPWFAGALAAAVFFQSAVQLIGMFRGRIELPVPLSTIYAALRPWHLTNGYGLFAVMTTTRHEIVIEGSADGKDWREYPFRWKPGDVLERPQFVAPHQPRLDWQMWFAALSPYRNNPWFLDLLVRLLQGSPEVLGLFASNPFPEAPPIYIRALVYDYRFTTLAEKRASGAWWKRELKGLYCPVASFRRP